ncbi:ADP-ribosylglycohydrolase family protein [soil metagenome]
MLGAIIGDIAGSPYERTNLKSLAAPLFARGSQFTDDTVLTVATADVLMNGGDYTEAYQRYGRRFPNAGYGGTFRQWIVAEQPASYGSWGNGSAMRASPIGWACESIEQVLTEARCSAQVTHDHPEGIKGAQAAASAVFLARTSHTKTEIKNYLSQTFSYDLHRTIEAIRPSYAFDVSCQGSVPEAVIAFLESENFEHALRLAISLGGDSDTIASITGAIAHAFYREIPVHMTRMAHSLLAPDLDETIRTFCTRYAIP